jgi:hypothetical protein
MPTIEEHLRNPDVSIDDYVRSLRIQLGEWLSTMRAVYLDTRFWILLRDAAAARGTPATNDLLCSLKDAVRHGRLFCPISDTTLFEVLKQHDLASRRATVTLIDELSRGATLVGQQERVGIEISHLFHEKSGRGPLHPRQNLVWSKLAYVIGEYHPSNTAFDQATERAVQKAFFDHMWMRSLTDVIDHISSAPHPEDDTGWIAALLNDGIGAHADELESYAQAYAVEARGLCDLAGDMALDAVDVMARRERVSVPSIRDLNAAAPYKILLTNALTENKARHALGTLHVLASLHAALRWNRGRRVKANDLADFDHAAAALVYCDAFFTEGSLATMVTQNHIALDSHFQCFVTSKVADAQKWIERVQMST